MGRCPSGQREQTVNLPAQPTGVQIPPGPPNLVPGLGDRTGHFAGVLEWLISKGANDLFLADRFFQVPLLGEIRLGTCVFSA